MDVTDSVSTAELLQLKRQEYNLLQRRAELLRTAGLTFYRPHAKQILFHSMAHKHHRFARTGNRFGKSEMGAAEDVAFALGYRPWIPKGNPMREHGIPKYPTKGLIITSDWEKSTEVFTNLDGTAEIGKLFRFIPADRVKKTNKNHSGAIDKIIVMRDQGMGESIIQIDTIKSASQNAMGQESAVFDWLHIDEPCPREMYIANARGLVDRGGKDWFTCTPLTQLWINDMFVPNRRAELNNDTFEFEDEKGRRNHFMLVGSMYDNPFLTEEAIESFVSLLTEDEKACRINGIPLALAGLVYKEFKPDEHVYTELPIGWSAFNEPPADYTIRYAIDPHPKKPTAVLFIATSPQGKSYVYDEIWEETIVPELADMIHRRMNKREAQDALIDPLAKTRDPITGSNMMQELINRGIIVREAVKDPSFGIMRVKDLLRSRDVNGQPNIFFSADVTRTLWEFDHFLWDPKTNKPFKENDDMLECLYRLSLTDLEYVSPIQDSAYRRIGLPSYDSSPLTKEDLTETLFESSSATLPLHVRIRRERRRKHNDAY